jgi:SAM-dependent methyltransferase
LTSRKKWERIFAHLDSVDFSSKKNLRRLREVNFFNLTDSNDLILDLFSGRCDTSYGLQWYRKRVISGDLSFDLLTINGRVKNKIQLNSLSLPFKDGQFNAVIIQGGLHHLESFDQIVMCCNEIKRILKAGGYIFISEPGDTVLLKIWLFLIKKTPLWKLTRYSRNWHFLYKEEEKTHSLYLTNINNFLDYLRKNWVVEIHKLGLVTEFFALKNNDNKTC